MGHLTFGLTMGGKLAKLDGEFFRSLAFSQTK